MKLHEGLISCGPSEQPVLKLKEGGTRLYDMHHVPDKDSYF